MRDSEVVASIVAGDPRGLAVAYDRYADPLYKYCRTLLSDPADAADAVQDAFVIAASRLDGLRDPGRLRAWLYAVARHEALRMLRSKKGSSALDEAPDVSDDSADVGERADLRALLEDATDGLKPGEREVIELQLRHGLEPGDVAAVLGVSRNHAHTLLSRARQQLAACLAVLLVGRVGRGECGELDIMLAGWDGRLTVLLRKRVHRHIEHCATCAARRAFELRPAMLLDLSPGAALAAGAELSLRLAAGAPAGLREHTITLATGQGAGVAAHRSALLSRAGAFNHSGFPKSAHGAKAGLAAHGGGAGRGAGTGTGGAGRTGGAALRSSAKRQATVAAVVVAAVAVAAAAFALTGNSQSPKPAADPKPPTVSAAAAVASSAATLTQTQRTPAPTPDDTSAAAASATRSSATPSQQSTSAASTPTPTPTAASPTANTPSPLPTTASPAPTPKPSATPTPTPTPGTLSQYPQGGTAADPQPLVLVPNGAGRQIDLSASGSGDWYVNWSLTVANDPGGAIGVSPASSGTLTAADTTATLTITADQYIPCGSSSSPTITVNPGGAVFSVCTSLPKHYGGPGGGGTG